MKYNALFAVTMTVFAFILAGCGDAILSNTGSEKTDSKLRNEHLLYDAPLMAKGNGNARGRGQGQGVTTSDAELAYGGDASAPRGRKFVVRFKDRDVSASKFLGRYKLLGRYTFDTVYPGAAFEIEEARVDSFLQAIESDTDVEWIEPDAVVGTEKATPSTTPAKDQVVPWNIRRIGADESSTASGDRAGTVDADIYVFDTGVKSKDVLVVDELKFLPEATYTTSSADHNGHGTHVAAIAAAEDDDDYIVGVAPGARVHSIKVLDDNGDTDISNVISAVDFVTKRKLANPDTPIVVNISFGGDIGTTEYNSLDLAIVESIRVGVVYVIAAGNEGIDASTITPAHVKEAITVGAFSPADRYTKFSNYGAVIDIAAPGVDILSSDIGNARTNKSQLSMMSGTSSAAPHVAGAAALYLSQHPNATPQDVRDAIVGASRSTLRDLPADTPNRALYVGGF